MDDANKIINNPFDNGYCIKCKHKYQVKCMARTLYGKPVPIPVIKQCTKFESKEENKE